MQKATDATKNSNDRYKEMEFVKNNTEETLSKVGLVASFNELEIKDNSGKVIWSQLAYNFLTEECPSTVNPSLWSNAKCNHETGLFKVSDEIYQIRGFDMANLTLILTPNRRWIVFDTLMSIECSRAAVEFANQWFEVNDLPIIDYNIAAIFISHSHVDHFGGIRGLFPDFCLDETVPIYVPSGFTKAAITENLMAGSAMERRASYQYGTLLEKSPFGALSIGIGQGQSLGSVSFSLPTKEITENESITIDGLELIIQLTQGTEAPAEMNTYIPKYKALWMAENCTCTMHNLYTLRGAEVRDPLAWAKYLLEARELFANSAKVIFHAHTWPRYNSEQYPNEIGDYILNQARLYKGIHDQTLGAINKGFTMSEVEEKVAIPKELLEKSYLRPYYGTISHNAKAVYQKYMGWYDSNPSNLHPLSQEDEAKKIIHYMGGEDAAFKKAEKDFENGEYRWVARIANWLTFSNPNNTKARNLGALALTQLGYQSESGTWRNEYLSGAMELTNGVNATSDKAPRNTNDVVINLSGYMLLDYLSLFTEKINSTIVGTVEFTDDWDISIGEIGNIPSVYRIDYWKGILTYALIDRSEIKNEDSLFVGTRSAFLEGIANGELDKLSHLFNLTQINFNFNIIEP